MQTTTSERMKAALANVLPRSADVHADGSQMTVAGIPVRVEWVGEGWLGDVRPVLDRDRSAGLPDILLARRMSPGAREAIAAAGLSWVDETGAAEVVVDSIVVSREGHTPRRSSKWTPSVLAIAEALLCGSEGTIKAVGEATGLSGGSCTKALRTLEDAGLLVSDAARGRHSGRRVDDPDPLLDAYAAEVANERPPPSVRAGVTWRAPHDRLVEIGRTWDAAGVAWACTGEMAASMLAPYLTSSGSADVYVGADTLAGLERIAAEAGLRTIDGGRLGLRPFPTVAVRRLATTTEGLRLAPWPRVYADLRMVGVRGEEAAEHLRQVMRGH